MAFDNIPERTGVVGVAVPGASIGIWPNAAKPALWRSTAANSYLITGGPPPSGTGDVTESTILGGWLIRTDANTPLGG